MNAPCAACGADVSWTDGHLVPLCAACESAWAASPERAKVATARRRFADRCRVGGVPELTIGEAQAMVGEWADRVFPDRTVYTTLAKLVMEEIPEFLMAKADDAGEYADLVILILDVAHQKRIDVGAAVMRKHQRNVGRAWARTESGIYHNVGDADWGGPT